MRGPVFPHFSDSKMLPNFSVDVDLIDEKKKITNLNFLLW